MKCWNCQAETEGRPFCPSCGKIAQRPAEATHFDVFGLPRSHALDVGSLEKQFRELSLKLHPDRFAQAEPKERRLSLEHTTALNDALRTLKDPARRAFYLLKLHGVDLDREDAGAQKDMPLEFLEEVMELREELSEARAAKDVQKARKMADGVTKRRASALEAALASLGRLEAGPDAAALKNASHELARVRYFTRFLEEVDAIEEEALG